MLRGFARFWRRTSAIAEKEAMHIARDPSTLAFALVMPLLLLLLFGVAVSFDLDGITVRIVDQDHTATSRAIAGRLLSGPTFVEVPARPDLASARADGPAAPTKDLSQAFVQGEVKLQVIVPRGLEAKLARSEPAPLQALVDAADNSTAGTTLGYLGRFVEAENRRLLVEALRDRGQLPLEARSRSLYNPTSKSVVFLAPGLIALVQSMMAVLLTALTVAREWERGTMEQLFATPVGRLSIVFGKLGPYFLIATIQLLLVLVASLALFDVPARGSMIALATVSGLFLVATLGQGLLISVVTKNQMVATQLAAVSSMLPAVLLSGFVMPIDNMPKLLQWLTQVLPARHLVHALRAILLRGAPWSVLVEDLVALGLFAAVMLSACTLRFRRTLATASPAQQAEVRR